MNLFDFVTRMKEMDGILGYVGAGLLVLFLLLIVFKMLGGMRRGTWRQLVRTAATLAAAVASFIAGVIVSNNIIGSLKVENLEGLIHEIEGYVPEAGDVIREVLGSIDTEMIEYMLLLPATIFVIPLVTTVCFLVLNLIFSLIRALIL